MKLSFIVVSLLLLFKLGKSQLSFTQAPGSPFSFSNMLRGAIATDVNGDGIKDFLTGSPAGVYVGLGNGSGQFFPAPGSPINIPNYPIYIAIANFNGDAFPDLATANYNGGNISVFLGTGTGSFVAANNSPINTGGLPYCIDAADFNMDGNIDLITSSVNANTIYLLLGNGSGSFSLAAGFPLSTGAMPYHVVARNFNSDNFPDFAFVNGSGNSLQVYLGNGTGTFIQAAGSPYNTGTQPRTIAVKDLDNNGILDLVIPNLTSNNLTIMMGLANGSFSASVGSPVTGGTNPYQSVIADFNMDGIQDIGFTNRGSNDVIIKLGLGNGSFSTGATYLLGSEPQPICTADFNGDNKPDIAFGDWLGSNVHVLINKTIACALSASFNYTINPASGQVSFNSSASGTTGTTTYSWNYGNGNSGTGSSSTHTYIPGTYTVTLIVNSTSPSCSITVSHTLNIPVKEKTGINIVQPDYFTIYPNPATLKLNIKSKISLLENHPEVTLYSITGHQLMQYTLIGETEDLDISVLLNGLYYYQIRTTSGKMSTGRLCVLR